MKTELIASWKLVETKNGQQYIINTYPGNTIWAKKEQFDTNSEQITFRSMKKGDKYTKADKSEGVLKEDRNEFLGCGRQIIKKYSQLDIIDHMISKGIEPKFALS